jgi:CHAD domain-containing protein
MARVQLRTCRRELDRTAEPAASGDAEALHDFRVAARRARVALEAFRKSLRATQADRLERRLSALNRRLGPARDLDVLLENLRRARARSETITAWERRRAATLRLRRRVLAGAEWARARADLNLVLAGRASGPAGRGSARKFAARKVRKAYRVAARRHRRADARDVASLHRVRIALRKVRMLAEAFSDVLGRDGRALARSLYACERPLGRAHDARLAIERIGDGDPDASRFLRKRQRQGLRRFAKAWRRLRRTAAGGHHASSCTASPR